MNNNDMDFKAKELQRLLEQFYQGGDSPKHKEIDTVLNNYKAQSDSYEHVKYYLTHCDNQFIIWFSLSVIEDKVNKSWNNIPQQDQVNTKNLLLDIYLNKSQKHKSLPTFIVSKLGQVIADIGRYEFEKNPQGYLQDITNLVRNPITSIRGVNLLQCISESFTTNKKVITQQKKNQLKKLLTLHTPIIIGVLSETLNQLFDQNAEKKFKNANLLAFQVGSPDTNTYTGSFSAETKIITKAVFDALLSYFSWMPLNDLLTPSLIDILFKYLRLDKNSVPALECLNELLSKNLVPKGFEEFLIRIFHQIYSLLTDITSNNGQQINQYNPDFISKFTQFIQLFVTNHLKRVETNPNFPISDFLALLFQYSFIQTDVESFLLCIDIWSTFFDYLITRCQENGIPAPTKYTDGLLVFQSELIKRILYSFSRNTLSDIDDESEELNEVNISETPLESYIKKCIEVVAKVTELYPEKSLENLYPLFTQNVTSFFCKAEENIKHGLFMDQNDVQLQHLIKDTTTILQLFGRLADQFVNSFAQTFNPANFIFQKLLDMCSFSTSQNTFKNGSDWEKLQIQLLNTIRSFSYWLSEYGNQVRAVVAQQPDFDNNISKLITIIVPLFERSVPEEISIASGKLLMSLVVIAKPLNLFTQMDSIIGNIHSIVNQLPTNVQTIIYPAISCTILMPPSNVNLSQQWDQRRPKYSPFIKGITSSLIEIQQIPSFCENREYYKDQVLRVLKIMKAIIKSVPEATMARGILHDGIQDTLLIILSLFRIYINYPVVLITILDFFFSLFETLKTQVGVVFTQQTITTFLEVLGTEDLTQLLTGSNETGISIVNKLLEILTFVVQTSGHNFESLLNSTVEYAMEKIYPIIANNTSQVKPSFFILLYSILDCHWKNCQPVQINKILSAFQTTFQQNDVNLFKQNLELFEKLNTKLKLYDKIAQMEPVFGCSFISMFFDVLISNTQSVHTDDIIVTIYKFASTNFDKFFNEFLHTFLIQKNQITNEQKQLLRSNFSNDKDQPTFVSNVTQLINDFSYFTFINS
ncbi:hypothetical protein DICPUDRAFT_48539 [Dictyostelium purpureum]|uniref:Exportin-1/Importin-beta-like domain-containing protein n=1 Tax=Dictyostelium purpureum TaxID=5786 RepID=F0ZPK1_DICPU|nr:uncharacterized protein DICPUDRAFT_48539 [Dictyostelium purpureum]EGC34136.1 hypothetical protein DICPUDRAFT_48539 [Dictyostelium purpureum]|eukprot:XP_003289334.1 hypothetical protein DICPUDRAFT_48539 [Dictyostelium purpureum]